MSGGGGDNKVKESAAHQELARIATEKMILYDDELAPLENLYFDKVDATKSQPQKDFLTGSAAKSTERAFADVENRISGANIERGVDPNSGRFKSDIAEVQRQKADSSGESQALAEITQEDEYVGGLQNIVAMGAGQDTKAQEGITRLAQYGEQKAAADAQQAWNSKVDRLDIAGSVAGAGAWWLNKKKSPSTATDSENRIG